jgi:hypothetical protein
LRAKYRRRGKQTENSSQHFLRAIASRYLY